MFQTLIDNEQLTSQQLGNIRATNFSVISRSIKIQRNLHLVKHLCVAPIEN